MAILRRSALPMPRTFEAEFHVLQGGHVREKRVGLEHHGHLALVDRHAGDVLAADHDAAALDVFEAGERAQRGGLAAAGAAEQHDHFAGLDVQVEVVERVNGGAGVDLDDVAHLDGAAAALGAVFEQGLGGLGHVLAAHAFEGGGGIVLEGVLGGSGRGGAGAETEAAASAPAWRRVKIELLFIRLLTFP